MKTIRIRLLVAAVAITMAICSCGNDTAKMSLSQPSLVSSVPADGSDDVTAQDMTVVLTFDQPVRCPESKQGNVTAGDATVLQVYPYESSIRIKLSGLKRGHKYDVTVPAGTVLGAGGRETPEVKISFSTSDLIDPEPCTPNPMPQMRAVYKYLDDIYGVNTLTSSMALVNWNFHDAGKVFDATGSHPAIATLDFLHIYADGSWINYSDTSEVEEWVANNGLVGACWHWNVPISESTVIDSQGNGGTFNTNTSFKARNVPVEGTWENKVANSDLEKVAEKLKLLQDKGIPVLWRPLHEASGNIYQYSGGQAWFWWGDCGADAYKKLWVYMFEFFRDRGINNLIWVWTTQLNDKDFYPGDEYVDIIGRDIYSNSDAANIAMQFNRITSDYPSKMIALSECGNVASISSQWNAGAHWLFSMPWYSFGESLDDHGNANTAWWLDAIGFDKSINREMLPSWK